MMCFYSEWLCWASLQADPLPKRNTRDLRKQHSGKILYGPQREKTCLRGFANNTGAEQPAHPRSLISAFVIRFLVSIISRLATSGISIF